MIITGENMDKGEQIREQLRQQIYEKDKRMRQKEEQMLENVMSFEECFEKDFLKVCKAKKFGKKSLQDFFMEQGSIKDYPQKVVLKNNIDKSNLQTIVFDIVKKQDAGLFEEIKQYKDSTEIKFSCCGIFCYDFVCTYFVNYIVQQHGYSYRSKYDVSKHSRVDVRCDSAKFEQKNAVINFSKNKVAKNLKFINIADTESEFPQNIKISNTDMSKIYNFVKKQIIKNIEQDKKIKFAFKNHTLVGADVESFDLTYVLLPCYQIRVKKPGFDIKFKINANSKKLVK